MHLESGEMKPDRWQGYRPVEVVLLHMLVLGPVAFALVLSMFVTADQIEAGVFSFAPPCLFKMLFGVACPTCGLTRAFCSISHGEFSRALDYNSMSFVAYGIFIMSGVIGLKSLLNYVLTRKSKEIY